MIDKHLFWEQSFIMLSNGYRYNLFLKEKKDVERLS